MAVLDAVHPGRKIFGQGSVLFSGFVVAQICSFLRNAMLGHLLSKGDFGIAATIAITLQLIEIISDLAADRMILQAPDGDSPGLINTAHVLLILRGTLISACLWFSAPVIVQFFGFPDALWAFQWIALVPFIKGFMHLDVRRMQRHLDHKGFAIVEAFPQFLALGLVLPFLNMVGGYETVVFLAIVQTLAGVATSHFLARRTYGLAFDKDHIRRFIAFGWPILLSALPLIAVYQGDRIIVGRYLGMENLAVYSAAFMLAMVPGLLTSKVCLSLVMPLLAEVRDRGELFLERFRLMSEGVVIVASAYVVFFAVFGGHALGFAFGKDYSDQGPVIMVLAIMWGLRIIQSAPGTGLMSLGVTKPILTAGIVRALALFPILYFASRGVTLEEIAWIGAAAELASLGYVCYAMERVRPGAGTCLFKRSVFYLAVVSGLLMLGAHGCDDVPLWSASLQTLLGVGLVLIMGLYFFTSLWRAASNLPAA